MSMEGFSCLGDTDTPTVLVLVLWSQAEIKAKLFSERPKEVGLVLKKI